MSYILIVVGPKRRPSPDEMKVWGSLLASTWDRDKEGMARFARKRFRISSKEEIKVYTYAEESVPPISNKTLCKEFIDNLLKRLNAELNLSDRQFASFSFTQGNVSLLGIWLPPSGLPAKARHWWQFW